MASLTSLPLELKREIARMVAAQDVAFLQRQEDGIFASLADRAIGTPWHGKGSNQMFQVSKEWNQLFAPVLFETIHASKTGQPIFQYRILKRHSSHIHHIVLDDDEGESAQAHDALDETYLPSLAVMWSLGLPSVTRLTLGPHLMELLLSALGGLEETDETLFHATLSELIRPITSLVATGISADPLEITTLLRLAPNVQFFTLEPASESLEQDAMDAIDGLKELESLTIIAPDSTGFPLTTKFIDWIPPKSIRKVVVRHSCLEKEEWQYLSIWARNSEELVLDITDPYHDEDFPPELTVFPNLVHLTIHASSNVTGRILRGFDAPLLQTLHLDSDNLSIPLLLSRPTVTIHVPSQGIHPHDGESLERMSLMVTGRGPDGEHDAAAYRQFLPLNGMPYPDDDHRHEWQLKAWSSHATGMLGAAQGLMDRHVANDDTVAGGMLIRALHGLRTLLALERD
ncbi:hypothetical protein RQP46_000187 [Phenoliferia psychrophenolica]